MAGKKITHWHYSYFKHSVTLLLAHEGGFEDCSWEYQGGEGYELRDGRDLSGRNENFYDGKNPGKRPVEWKESVCNPFLLT